MVLAKYSQPKLLVAAGFLAALAVACGYFTMQSLGSQASYFWPIAFLGCAALAAKGFAMACGSLTALEHSPAGLVVHTNWSRIVVPWTEYAGITIEGWVYRVSFIPVGKVNYLLIRQHTGGLFGNKKIRLTLGAMDLAIGDVRALGERIDEMAQKGGAIPAQASGVAQPVVQDAGPRTSDAGFDPDAAIARYMAAKAAQLADTSAPSPPPQPARPSFGRKGLSA